MSLGKSPRGCGKSRDTGAIYMEVGSEEGGLPMYQLIQDPVRAVDPKALGLTPVGVKLIEVDGVTHVFDWVGAKHYPNASDFIEEAIRLGISRRISKKEDFSKLTPESRLVLVHPRAFVSGHEGVPYLAGRPWPCPTGIHDVEARDERCAGLLWLLGEPGTTDMRLEEDYVGPRDPFPEWAPGKVAPQPSDTYRVGRRSMPAFTYSLGERPHDIGVTLSPGIIMVAPIERLAVISDPNDQAATNDALAVASGSSLPVSLEAL